MGMMINFRVSLLHYKVWWMWINHLWFLYTHSHLKNFETNIPLICYVMLLEHWWHKTWRQFRFGLGVMRYLCRDGIHLSAEGSKVVVEEILKALKNVNWEPSLYWLSILPEFGEDSPYYPVNLDGKTTYNISANISTWQRQWLNI